MTTETMLIQGGTKERRMQEAMKKVVRILVKEPVTWEGRKTMNKNTHVLFVTQMSHEECSTLLNNTLNEYEENASSPKEKDFFVDWKFRKEQEHKNSLIHFATLNELIENWEHYALGTGIFFKGIVVDNTKDYNFLVNSGLADQLFSTTHFDETHLVATANNELNETTKARLHEDFKCVLTLKDNNNKRGWSNSAGKEKVEEKQTTEESSIFDLFGKDFDSHAETLKELASEWSNSINEYLNTLDDTSESNEASESTETDESKLRMFTLIEERRQFAENTYNPDANYTLGYMDALYDLEQKLKTLK